MSENLFQKVTSTEGQQDVLIEEFDDKELGI